ncbi:MAG: BioY protein, partial [Dehalococcoidia bacterium]|nr:BioY protein [Dehalococcoidia bacterium]
METTVRTTTLADVIVPRGGILQNALVRDVILILAFSWFVALCAQIRVPLPFTPVPITGQTLGVLLTGAVLGSKRGGLSLLVYAAQGAIGLHVFTPGTTWGMSRIMGPSGGYIIGFVIAAFVIGWLAERGWDRRHVAAAMLIGNVAVYVPGLLWLARFLPADGNV